MRIEKRRFELVVNSSAMLPLIGNQVRYSKLALMTKGEQKDEKSRPGMQKKKIISTTHTHRNAYWEGRHTCTTFFPTPEVIKSTFFFWRETFASPPPYDPQSSQYDWLTVLADLYTSYLVIISKSKIVTFVKISKMPWNRSGWIALNDVFFARNEVEFSFSFFYQNLILASKLISKRALCAKTNVLSVYS